MAVRVHALQNSLWNLSPLSFTNPKINILNRTAFSRQLPLSSSPKSSMFCTCSSPNSQNDTFVITTPLYYVNAPPHMGSAYTTIAADAIARFQRLMEKKVIFVTGTDEHGEKIATAAAAVGSSPSDHCNTISQAYRMLWKELDIAYDKFIRTTNPSHDAIVNEFYSRVLTNGDIYQADYEGLYCVNCEEYKVQGWIKTGLKDFSISRAAVDWGIRVPGDHSQTIYVWFDALLGYVSALLENKEQPSLQDAVAFGWPASLHLIGKDILRFHAVYWPAMLMSAGLSLPKMVFGHGFLTKVGKASTHYQNLSLSSACEAVLEIGNAGNLYMDERAPWSLFKQGGTAAEAAAKDLVIILEAMRIISIALLPVAPRLCWRIYSQLGYSEDEYNSLTWNDAKWGGLKAGHVMPEAKPVFTRIELVTNGDDVAQPAKKNPKNKVKKVAKAQSA